MFVSFLLFSWSQVARARGVDCVVAPYEADAQLAYLTKSGLAQAVITEDSDLLAYGCKKVSSKDLCVNLHTEVHKSSHKKVVKQILMPETQNDSFFKACNKSRKCIT